jgi:hypothetical protein
MSGSVHHATATELGLYVIDALAPEQHRRLEEHVAACHDCARLLALEAAAEMDLRALWPEVQQVRQHPLAAVVPLRAPGALPGPRALPAARPSTGGLAVAAVALLFVGWGTMDHHRHATDPSGSALAPAGSCLASRLSAPADDEPADGPLCLLDAPPPPAGLASWAACASPRR